MNKETLIRIRRIYDTLLCISIFIAGICLVAGCLSIYYSGDQPYSREAVADTFAKIAVPIWTCLAFTVGGFVWELFLPSSKNQKNKKAFKLILERLSEKKSLHKSEESLRTAVIKERKSRHIHAVIRTVILCVGCAVFLIYALNPANFDRSDINGSIIKAMYVLLPCLSVPFGYAVFTAYHGEKSVKREIELLKNAPSKETDDNMKAVKADGAVITVLILRVAFFIVAAVAIVYGFITGGTADVLTKAINICTECIGLG